MLQDIAPHVYAVEFREQEAKEQDRLLCYAENRLLALDREELDFPRCGDLPRSMRQARYLFSIDGEAYFLHQGPPPEEVPGCLFSGFPAAGFPAAGKAAVRISGQTVHTLLLPGHPVPEN